jgi:two-component system NtrC family sensor kinase
MQPKWISPTTRLLELLIGAVVVLPVALFAYAAWETYRALDAVATERVERTLDVLQEHALRVFQTIDRTIAETNEVLRGLSDDQIRAEEAWLHDRLRETHQALPTIESIWAFDRDGRPLFSTTVLPVPPTLDNSDRDYFRAQATEDTGTFIGSVISARIGDHSFFVVSRRRPTRDGRFNGIVAMTVPPTNFRSFYARVVEGTALSAGLIRADGAFLARYPVVDDATSRLTTNSAFVKAIAVQPDRGSYTTATETEGIERRISYRKLPGYPVYVHAGFTNGALWDQLRSTMTAHLVFGLPATALLLLLSTLALRRTREFLAETQRREIAEAALKQAQRLEALGQLTGGVAHDFNNLLTVVNGNVERLRRDIHDSRHVRALDAIDKAARRGSSLTRQLLTFSRMQTVVPVVVQLCRQLPKLREMLQSSLRGDIALTLDISDRLWPARVDLGELELAILNLAINARDAMPNGGTLTLSARNATLAGGSTIDDVRGDVVAISVRDTGIGIPTEILPKVFEPFFTTKEVGKGTGLGLSQVYGFAKQAGGTATVTSEVGRGTEITIYLPRSQEAADGEDEDRTSVHELRGEGTILLVEDNAEIAEVTKSNLEQLGYRVVQAMHADAALETIEKNRTIDLVFSDIVMPGAMNGLDLARRLRELRPELPIILTTGYSSALNTATPAGFTLLSKPYDLHRLHEAIDSTLREHGAKVVPLITRRRD